MNIINCPNCGGEVRSETIGWICRSCGGFISMDGTFHAHVDKPFMPPLTNADRIRAMSDEELGRFCIGLTDDGWRFACKNKPECDPAPHDPSECNECFMEWLSQPAKEESDEKTYHR